jgi:hypothetical protein
MSNNDTVVKQIMKSNYVQLITKYNQTNEKFTDP